MVLDPKKHADWEIAQDAETRMVVIWASLIKSSCLTAM